jgi:orotate phosphoribosyltransferase
MTQFQALADLLRERSVTFGDFVLSSGQRSSYYIDARKTTMSAQGQRLIGTTALAAIRQAGWTPDAVGGLTMGADPVAYAIARASLDDPPAIDAFSVRKAVKQHGTGRRIEGNFESGISVVIIEDVITAGGSAQQAIDAVTAEGGKILGVLAIVDREQGGRQAIESRGIIVVALTTTTSLGLK